MKKELLSEINRIRQIMNLKPILTESAGPLPGLRKLVSLLQDIFTNAPKIANLQPNLPKIQWDNINFSLSKTNFEKISKWLDDIKNGKADPTNSSKYLNFSDVSEMMGQIEKNYPEEFKIINKEIVDDAKKIEGGTDEDFILWIKSQVESPSSKSNSVYDWLLTKYEDPIVAFFIDDFYKKNKNIVNNTETTLSDNDIIGFFNLVSTIPWSKSAKFRDKVDLNVLQQKIINKTDLNDVEIKFIDELNADKDYLEKIKLGKETIESVSTIVKNNKKTYIEKFGQDKYDELVNNLLNKKITKSQFIEIITTSNRNTSYMADFMISYGIKFSNNELQIIEDLVKRVDSTNVNESWTQEIKIIGRNGQEEMWKVDAKNFGNEVIWVGNQIGKDKVIQINLLNAKTYDQSELRELITHEIGHAKDPQLYKSAKLEMEYDIVIDKISSYSKNISDLKNAKEELFKEVFRSQNKIAELKRINPNDPEITRLSFENQSKMTQIRELEKAVNSVKQKYDQQVKIYETLPQEYNVRRGAVINDFTQRVQENLPSWGKEHMLKTLTTIENDIKGFNVVSDPSANFLFGKEYDNFYNIYLKNKPSLQKNFHNSLYNQIQNLKKQLKLF